MLVRNKAHSTVIVEHNGTRYMFSNDGKPVDIPVDALVNAYKSGHIHSCDLIPVENEDNKKTLEENKLLKAQVLELNNIIADLERKVSKNARKK